MDTREITAFDIQNDLQKLDDHLQDHSKLTSLLDSNKLNAHELDDLGGYLSLLLEAIDRVTYNK